MKNLLFTLRYDGTDYHGWQVQENANTVQQTFQDAAERICGVRDNVIGCSRTDSGVHADMYCCNMRTESSLSPEKWKSAMNGVLPHDIAVTDCREVPFEFHARYDCSGKRYVYRIWNAQERGAMFITPGTKVYAGMVIGVTQKSDDVPVNVCRTKHLTNTRASGSDEALRLVPPRQLSLEQCLEFLADDELLEVTPKNLRLRKSILDHSLRMKNVMRNR